MIYLDNAATSFPKPEVVYEKTWDFMRRSGGNPGRAGHRFSLASGEMVEQTRREVSRFFKLPDPRRVVFTYNCTDSINIVLKGHLHEGDHVVTTNLDHNSISRPLHHLTATKNIEVTRVPFDSEGSIDPERFRSKVRKSTTLLVITHGSNVLGCVQPLAEFIKVAKQTGIPLLVDASQTAGHIPIHIADAPVFLVCSGHKGLFGMPGIGLLAVPEGFQLNRWREGGSGTVSENLEHPDELPMRLEAGTTNFLSIASLHFALEFIEQQSLSSIHETEMRLAWELHRFLREDSRFVLYSSSRPDQLSVIAFNVRNAPPDEVGIILDQEFGCAVRTGLHCAAVLHKQLGTSPEGCIRISPGYFNTREEIELVQKALERIAEGYK